MFTVLKKRCLADDSYSITSLHFIEGAKRNLNKYLKLTVVNSPHIFKLLCLKINKNLAKP